MADSGKKSNQFSPSIKKLELPDRACYSGPSMNPTLKTGDILQVVPCSMTDICPGDVIVFPHPKEERKIVHRVVTVTKSGVITQGDNCPQPDTWLVPLDKVLGKVDFARRNKKLVKIRGGLIGILLAKPLRQRKKIILAVNQFLSPIYQRFSSSGVLNKMTHNYLPLKIVHFKRSNGIELQLVLGRKTIGRLVPGQNHWIILKPYRLIIDESALPKGTGDI